MMPLTIYTVASARQRHAVRLLNDVIRGELPGIQILTCAKVDKSDADKTYLFYRDACRNADLLIYFGESGQDAGVAVGMASAWSVPVLGLRGPLEEPGLMLRGAVDMWVSEIEEALKALRRIATCELEVVENCPECDLHLVCPRYRAEYVW